MSTPAKPAAPAPGAPPAPGIPKELRIYGHSAIFYWWPVWAFGYLMALITWVNGGGMAVLPPHSTYANNTITVNLKTPLSPAQERLVREGEFYIHMHPSKNLGVFFTIILLVVIFITNFPLRGLSSALAVTTILVVSLLFAVLDIWEKILGAFGTLAVFMNLGFYVFLSTVLFIIWVMVTFVFDRFHYWRVTPGQITHEYVFGGGQVSFDTEGIAIKKHRDDLFRHWVLGIGSGDIIMYPMQAAGSTREEMAIHNVLFVGNKLRRIQELIAERPA
jgi:hypothetical protein